MEENKIVEEKDIEEVENGTEGIKISSDVIAVIAGVAVSEVPGVFGMAGGFAGGITEVLKGKKNLAKGIKVDTTDNKAKIDVNIIVDYGARIPDVAFEIQNRSRKYDRIKSRRSKCACSRSKYRKLNRRKQRRRDRRNKLKS